MKFIGRFMIEVGLLSSVFDALTFGLLLIVYRAGPALFRTAWFVESLLPELAIALVVRTRRPFYRSRPGTLLAGSTAVIALLALAILYLPLVGELGFVPLAPAVVASLLAITGAHVVAAEVAKWWFFRAGTLLALDGAAHQEGT